MSELLQHGTSRSLGDQSVFRTFQGCSQMHRMRLLPRSQEALPDKGDCGSATDSPVWEAGCVCPQSAAEELGGR